MCRQAEFAVFFRRQIYHNQPVDACFLGVAQECVDAARIDRVVVAHQNDGGGGVFFTEITGELQCALQRHASFQGALPGELNGRAVRHGVGEGQAQFDDVNARCGQAFDHFERGVIIGIARHHIGHEGLLARGREFSKLGIDACGGAGHGQAFIDLCCPSDVPKLIGKINPARQL